MKTSSRCGLLASAVSLLLALSLHDTAHAGLITWGTPTAISGDSDVVNTGTVVGAFNLGVSDVAPSVTVNGVTFAPFYVPGFITGSVALGNFTLGFDDSGAAASFSASAPFSTLSSAYHDLLQRSVTDLGPGGAAITLTMQGRTVGQGYSFQWWSNLSSPGQRHTSEAYGGVTLSSNPSSADGGLGQYAVGTFTADSATQGLYFFSPDGDPLINAFQLRTVVPEPTSALLLLGSGIMLLLRRHRASAH